MLLGWLFVICIAAVIGIFAYYIIKHAVKNGIRAALSEIKIEQLEDSTLVISSKIDEYPDPLFEDNPDKSEQQKKIEKEIYILYGERKLDIDYDDTIENQKIAISKIVADHLRDDE